MFEKSLRFCYFSMTKTKKQCLPNSKLQFLVKILRKTRQKVAHKEQYGPCNCNPIIYQLNKHLESCKQKKTVMKLYKFQKQGKTLLLIVRSDLENTRTKCIRKVLNVFTVPVKHISIQAITLVNNHSVAKNKQKAINKIALQSVDF